MAFLIKKKDKKGSADSQGLTRSASVGGVLIRKPKSKNKAVAEYYAHVDEICHLLVRDENNFCCYLVSLGLGLSSVPRLMNTYSIFRQLVRKEYHDFKGDTSLLLRNTSDATKWMKGIVEAESADMVLLEKKVLWLLNKSCETANPEKSPPQNPATPTKKSSFLAPSVAIHQQIIQKEETHEGAGYEWCENGEAEVIYGFDKDLLQLCNCILGILYCCSQVSSLCRLVMATSDEVKKQQSLKMREGSSEEEMVGGGDEDSLLSGSLTHSSSAPARDSTFSSSAPDNLQTVQSCPAPEKKEKKGKEKEKEKKNKKGKTPSRAMRRKISEDERKLYGWTVTNIILLHFAVPVVASRSLKCKAEKKIVKFSKLVARSIMKVAANSDYGKGTDLERFNPVIQVLHQPYLNFCQDAVENGVLYGTYAPEIHRSALQHLRNDMAEVKAEEYSEVRNKISDLCDEAIRKAAATKKVHRQLSTEVNVNEEDNTSSFTEWRAPSMIEGLDNDDYSEASACPSIGGPDWK